MFNKYIMICNIFCSFNVCHTISSSIPVEIKANWKRKEVMVTQLGSNPSAIDTDELVKDKPTKLKQSSTLYVLVGLYPHIAKFSKQKYQPAETDEVPPTEVNTVADHKPAGQSETDQEPGGKHKTDNRIPGIDRKSAGGKSDNGNHGKDKLSGKSQTHNGNRDTLETSVSKNDRKRTSFEQMDKESKKRKLNHNDSDRDSDVTSVEGKLQMLKESAKKSKLDGWLHSPCKEDKKVENLHPELSTPGASTQEASWQQYEKLYIYTSKGVQAREKVSVYIAIDSTFVKYPCIL